MTYADAAAQQGCYWLETASEAPRQPPLDGEAGIFTHRGERLAVYRDRDSRLHAVSAICTHMKCIVGCPCHGSRFGIDGSVVYGPAVAPLTRRTID